MKKYKIIFTSYYRTQEDEDNFWKQHFQDYRKKWYPVIAEWDGKEITLLELENLMPIFERVVIEDDIIEVYNDYRE